MGEMNTPDIMRESADLLLVDGCFLSISLNHFFMYSEFVPGITSPVSALINFTWTLSMGVLL